LNVGNLAAGAVDVEKMVNPSDGYFDDQLFFVVHEDAEEDEPVPVRKDSNAKAYPVLKGSGPAYGKYPSAYNNHAYKE
jgi:hypothetical protein